MAKRLHTSCSSRKSDLHGSTVLATICCAHTAQMSTSYDKKQLKKDVGRRLREARMAVNPRMTQADAARDLGRLLGEEIEPSRVGNYEQGSRLPDLIVVRALARIYDVSPAWIYDLEDAAATPSEQMLLKKYRQTDERGKRAIQSIAESQPADAYQAGSKKLAS